MTEYTAQCRISRGDTITASVDGDGVMLVARFSDEYAGETYLRPDAARTFARGILALADEIDGGAAQEEVPKPAKREIKVGDLVRIVRNGYASEGNENVGEVGTVKAYDPDDDRAMYRVSLPDDDYGWWCAEVELIDEPADEPTTPANPRADFITQARELLDDYDHTVEDILIIARFLASE